MSYLVKSLLTSVVVLVTASMVGLHGMKRLRFGFLNRYGEVISGLLLTAVGLAMALLAH